MRVAMNTMNFVMLFLSDAWVGYKISDQQRVSVGLQPVEFGFGRFWGSSYYETLMNTVGFEDISALGLRYQISQNDYSLSLGFIQQMAEIIRGRQKIQAATARHLSRQMT